MYKPNFCAECGERVVRARWHVWTSRRLCQHCTRRMGLKARLLLPFAACALLFSSGLIFGLSMRHAPPPLVLERAQSAQPDTHAGRTSEGKSGAINDVGGTDRERTPEPAYGPDGSPTERPTEAGEVVSICGARTKKGSPCSRRVRGTGRCWQHKGKPAILPPDKLVVDG